MSRLFISHASANNAQALALARWLADNGWDDWFLDISADRGIAPGERLQTDSRVERVTPLLFDLPPIARGEFKAVIAQPAVKHTAAGHRLDVEQTLVERLLHDAEGADALPLLAFTLERLFVECGGDGDLRLAEYEALGGVRGSIEKAVDAAFADPGRAPTVPADKAERVELLRRGFIPWLVRVDPDTEERKRRMARWGEIPAETRPLLERLVEQRREQIAQALHGDYRAEHLFALRQSLELHDTYRTMIAECDGHIEHCLAGFDARVDLAAHPLGPPKHGHRTPRGNAARFDLRTHLYRIAGVDFTRIDGFDALTVQTILAEVGLDPSRFPSEKHFASWLALCPDNRITGGVVKHTKSRKVVSRVATALRRAAQSAANSRSALGGFYHRLRARLGPAKAITATAHKLARIFYRMWKYREPYHPLSLDHYETQYRERILASLRKRAAALGFELVQSPPLGGVVS